MKRMRGPTKRQCGRALILAARQLAAVEHRLARGHRAVALGKLAVEVALRLAVHRLAGVVGVGTGAGEGAVAVRLPGGFEPLPASEPADRVELSLVLAALDDDNACDLEGPKATSNTLIFL